MRSSLTSRVRCLRRDEFRLDNDDFRLKHDDIRLNNDGGGGFTTSAVNAVNALWGEVGLRVMQTEYEPGITNVTSWNIKADSYKPELIAAQRKKAPDAEVRVYFHSSFAAFCTILLHFHSILHTILHCCTPFLLHFTLFPLLYLQVLVYANAALIIDMPAIRSRRNKTNYCYVGAC